MPDKFSGDIDRRGGFLDYLVIILITIILVTFVIWANFTKLDLVTTGSGRLIASGQNKNVQAPVMGTISGFFVEEGRLRLVALWLAVKSSTDVPLITHATLITSLQTDMSFVNGFSPLRCC